MHKVTVTRAMLAGVSLQSFAGDGSTLELHDVRMEDVLGTAVVMDGNISATVTNTMFKHCNAGITARDAALQLTEVDILCSRGAFVWPLISFTYLWVKSYIQYSILISAHTTKPQVDMLGDEKRGVGLTLTSSSVRARDFRTVDLAAGLVPR